MFALVDCNNFYVSCERVFHPKLKNRPVIVLSNNDGCAVARSEEAKALGIEAAVPAFAIKELIEKHNVAVFSSNYTLYGDMSGRVMEVLRSFAPHMEVYSIDEAFLDLSHLPHHHLTELAIEIKDTVLRATGIPVSIGIAATKTLAKMANRFAKKKKHKIGVHCVDSEALREEVLLYTSIEDVWGIGRQYREKLKILGVETAYDLLQFSEEWMRKNMTVVGERMLNELKGIPCIPLEETLPAKKNICTSRSFGQLLTELGDIKEAVANYAARCAAKLRKQKSCARAVHVFLHTNAFREQDRQYSNSITIPLPVATSNTQEIMFYAIAGLNKIYRYGYNYIKAGVMVLDIVPETEVQQSLFDRRSRVKEKYVIETLDAVNRSWGRELVKFAVQGNGRKWKLRQEHLSPCYTTRMDQIKKIKI